MSHDWGPMPEHYCARCSEILIQANMYAKLRRVRATHVIIDNNYQVEYACEHHAQHVECGEIAKLLGEKR